MAVCIQCGASKPASWEACPSCHFRPTEDLDLAKSVYLSEGRFESEGEQASYREELLKAGRTLQAGDSVEYDPHELDRLLAQKALVDSVPPGAVWGALFRFFRPALFFFATMAVLIVLLRWLNS